VIELIAVNVIDVFNLQTVLYADGVFCVKITVSLLFDSIGYAHTEEVPKNLSFK